MNGAAMNCHQDPGPRPRHRDAGNPGYHLQINPQQNLQPQNSKTLNYPSFSSNYQVDGHYDNFHLYENNIDSRDSNKEVDYDPRFRQLKALKRRGEPIDLPVPKFEVDEHSVINDNLTQGSKLLDLDTRIDLLIKSKTLAGMHPIFSELDDSEKSDSNDSYPSRQKHKCRKENTKMHSDESDVLIRESFDDPEKPLSRPPSPFLNRATYLFWFNKAIEIKQQAQAQEQALLEKATKRLTQDTSMSLQTNQSNMPKKIPIPKNLMDEISKELKEVIKQEFIREIIEQTALNTLDVWWENQNQEEKSGQKEESEIITKETHENCQGSNSASQRSSSPKMPIPWKGDTNVENDKTAQQDSSEKCEVKCDGLNSTSEKRENHVVISCDAVENNDRVNLVSSEPISCEPEFTKKSELDQPPASNVGNFQDAKMDDKLIIVKDILDFIFNNVNKIVVQRSNGISPKKENEDVVCENISNLDVDSLIIDSVKPVLSEDVNVNL